MRGDFSRNTHRSDRAYSRVLWHQGRVILDADLNEQGEIQVRAMRQMMRDLVGPHGGPVDALGFHVEAHVDAGELELEVRSDIEAGGVPDEGELLRGRYYVDGIMVEHVHESGKPLVVTTGEVATTTGDEALLVYLEVWERHVTWLEENEPFRQRSMREIALGGPDTASRAQVRWRVGVKRREVSVVYPVPADWESWARDGMQELQPAKGTLAAKISTADIGGDDPCRDTAENRYRGPENRLYRVEIHEAEGDGGRFPTFKWSRENGAVVYPLEPDQAFGGSEFDVELVHLGRDDRHRLRTGDIVELVTDTLDEAAQAGPLLEVMEIDQSARRVRLEALGGAVNVTPREWALLRRWDQPHRPKRENGADAVPDAGAVVIDGSDRFVLEDGIVVWFEKPAGAEKYGFRPGDYWLIPARTIPGDIEWPRVDGEDGPPVPETPHGIERHYAPLAVVHHGVEVKDLRRSFGGLAKVVGA